MAEMAGDELDIKSAAQFAGRSAETLRRWVWSGRLRARKSGKHLLVLRGDLEALVGEQGTGQLSLREWGVMANKVLSRSRTGSSARDIILADRRERSA